MPPKAPSRKVRVIDPAKIETSEQWSSAWNGGYKNIVFGEDGALQVLDTELQGVVKIIPHQQGFDSTVVLAKELRAPIVAAATETQTKIEQDITAQTTNAQVTYLIVERNLLDTVEEWKLEQEIGRRRGLAMRIGELTQQLKEADTALRTAMYPHRYVKTTEMIPKYLVDYPTMDGRKIAATTVSLTKSLPTERLFTVEDMA
jgi:hypothetical protein